MSRKGITARSKGEIRRISKDQIEIDCIMKSAKPKN